MVKNNSLLITIIIIIMMTGCHDKREKITTFSHEPTNTIILDKEASYQRTYKVYYEDEIVSKMEIIDKTVFNSDDVEIISVYDKLNKATYETETFKVSGIGHISEINENIYISITIFNYDQMDMKSLIETDNWLIKAKEITNDELKVEYSRLEKMILGYGFKIIN
jgi:hypothetical protein